MKIEACFTPGVLLLSGAVMLAACSTDSGDDVDDSTAHVEQNNTVLQSKLYTSPDAKVNADCDEYTELTITKSGASFVATIENKLSPTSTCVKNVEPATRKYKVTLSDDCGSKAYKGTNGKDTFEMADHRTRVCEDIRPAMVDGVENYSGFTIHYYGAVVESAPGAKTCKVGSKTYKAGESFKDSDGCNTCTCNANGNIACTEKACAPANGGGAACKVGTKTYQDGESFPDSDGCNTCTCHSGKLGCTEKFCGN